MNSPGAMAMVVNMESHPGWRPAVARHAARPWPKEYRGPPRLIVPTVRGVVNKGESLALKIVALDRQPVRSVTVHVRPLGGGAWREIPAAHLARAVYVAKLLAAQDDFEYFVSAEKTVWPASAPQMSQTVVVAE